MLEIEKWAMGIRCGVRPSGMLEELRRDQIEEGVYRIASTLIMLGLCADEAHERTRNIAEGYIFLNPWDPDRSLESIAAEMLSPCASIVPANAAKCVADAWRAAMNAEQQPE